MNENPYAPPSTDDPPFIHTGSLKPHRGTTIVIFAGLGWSLCFAFGIVAWVMARRDLKEMEAGIMDRSGYLLTKVGYFLGVGTLVLGVLITALVMTFVFL